MNTLVPWPFFALQDDRGRRVPYVGLQAPVQSRTEVATLERVSQNAELIGFTSFLTFPACRLHGDDREYGSICRAWCHCFRDPDRYLPPDKPRALIAFSDFTDYQRTSPEALFPHEPRRPRWDFAYVCQTGRWKERAKNWALARRTIPVLCHELGLRGVLVGREHIAGLPECAEHLTVLGELQWTDLMFVLFRSRFLFVPNELDPSPRLMAEAMCMNIPIVVNRHVLGGWHYVNPFTGFFFEDEGDVGVAARYCLEQWTSPRRWFVAHHGPLQAGRRLQQLVASFDPSIRGCSRLEILVEHPRKAADSTVLGGRCDVGA